MSARRGIDVRATPHTVVLMPADVPHAVFAPEPARMLLIMLRNQNPPECLRSRRVQLPGRRGTGTSPARCKDD